jgi:peptidoglycan/xylan/chitin deacetylase (PgdA/CDA1 family)
MNVSPAAFREQMRWLADHCTPVSLDRAAAGGEGVAITFDDGYRDNLTEAAPVLDTFRIPATLFFVSGLAGATLDHDDPADESARILNWNELRELANGGWAIGGHTMTHARLSQLDHESQREEIAGCKREIEREIARSVFTFAYPFGSALDFTGDTTRIVRESGYALAVSNQYGVNSTERDPFALRRIWIDRSDSLASFAAKVEGRLDRLAWLDSPVGIRARRWANRLLRSA